MTVREAKDADYEQMDALCIKFFEEGQLKGTPKEDCFSTGLRNYVEMGLALCLVLVDGSKLLGGVGAMMTEDFITGDLVCTEMFWYVDPAYRRWGIRLHRELEKEAKNRGCSRILMVCLAKLNAEKMGKYYLRRGYELQEIFYTKNLT